MMLCLPYPPSSNRYWRVVRGHPVKSADAREYQRKVALLAKVERVERVEGPVRVEVSVYRPARRGDLDNSLKVLLDALNGIAYADDSQVVELFARRRDDAANPRVMVLVKPATGDVAP